MQLKIQYTLQFKIVKLIKRKILIVSLLDNIIALTSFFITIVMYKTQK